MVWFVSVAIAIILCGVAFLFGRAMRSEAEPGSPESDRGLIIIVLAVIVFVIWVGAHTALSALKQVEAGDVAVVYQFGEIIGQKGEGLQFVAPWQEIRTESIRVQRRQFSNVSGFSSETQDVVVTATVNYRVDPSAVQNLYRTVGVNWFDILVEPRINQYFKAETVKYSTVDIAPNRETIRKNVKDALAADLQNFSVTVEDLLIDNIDFNADFKRSIEEKQIAAQNALREGERIAQAQAEAVQNEERAKGEARAVEERAKGDAAAEIERARGNAEAILLRAEAQAQANVLLDESLTPQVIQYLAVDKLAPNIDIALIPSGQNIIIDPAALLSGASVDDDEPTQSTIPATTTGPTEGN
ncbi:MAG: SPFH domain-containing protein [Chloroflexi bacterium]|nr:SPFH domain-containing protein [Chloroflexota bacterium]